MRLLLGAILCFWIVLIVGIAAAVFGERCEWE